MYEYLLSEIATAGKNGQFRTPRHIIKLMAELVQPQLGYRICDPACGTGGFLLGAFQYIETQLALKKGAKGLKVDKMDSCGLRSAPASSRRPSTFSTRVCSEFPETPFP